ncbi:hypothetical protein B0487_0764 [Bifidobacterium adolescentis]|uniref:XRE family transcriptional regulator n=1 Tax=Bifidobacterium adolescentis TaxID=1680 RepID=A0A1X2Z0A9_BIFAD|nr:hypothetical protein [Bifidobacterium adolescentis]OSG87846.1 hypothetical protein B0487_0764 [Bifidobacterium adolescentis]
MARGSKNEVTEDSKRIIDVCRQLLKNSGITIDEFFDSSGLSNNYWYKRMRYEAPLNTSDVEHIASTFGLTSLDIYTRALGSDAARAYAAREREFQVTDDLVDRIAAHPENFDVAASKDPNKALEAETTRD